jgi:hypothetical protein
MHGLETIRRLNREAHEASITRARAKGLYVVGLYEGLHLVSFASFEEEGPAQAALKLPLEAGQSRAYWEPAHRTQAAAQAAA